MPKLEGKRIAILVAKGFEEVELKDPRRALQDAGAETHIISPEIGRVKSWDTDDWSEEYEVDVHLNAASPADYDALLLPGGVMNPDLLRMNPKAVEFVKHFMHNGKPVAAICHGPWTLVEADVLKGRTLTSYPSLKTDILNAGGLWVDQEVVSDRGLVTSRRPDDIAAFNRKMLEEFEEGQQAPVWMADGKADHK